MQLKVVHAYAYSQGDSLRGSVGGYAGYCLIDRSENRLFVVVWDQLLVPALLAAHFTETWGHGVSRRFVYTEVQSLQPLSESPSIQVVKFG